MLNDPGYFDVGIGIGAVTERPFRDTDGMGLMMSLRAYPAGRWYGTLKTSAKKSRDAFNASLAAALGTLGVLTAERLKGADAAEYLKQVSTRITAVVSANLDLSDVKTAIVKSRAADGGFGVEELGNEVARSLHRTPHDALAEFLQAVLAQAQSVSALSVDTLAETTVIAAANKFRATLETASETVVVTQDELAAVLNAVTESSVEDTFPQFYIVEDRDHFYHRISVFYGRSVTDVGGGYDRPTDLVGIAYDIAPQFALQFGWAFFDGDDDADSTYYFGTSLNLNAFKNFFGKLFGE